MQTCYLEGGLCGAAIGEGCAGETEQTALSGSVPEFSQHDNSLPG